MVESNKSDFDGQTARPGQITETFLQFLGEQESLNRITNMADAIMEANPEITQVEALEQARQILSEQLQNSPVEQ